MSRARGWGMKKTLPPDGRGLDTATKGADRTARKPRRGEVVVSPPSRSNLARHAHHQIPHRPNVKGPSSTFIHILVLLSGSHHFYP